MKPLHILCLWPVLFVAEARSKEPVRLWHHKIYSRAEQRWAPGARGSPGTAAVNGLEAPAAGQESGPGLQLSAAAAKRRP